MRASVVYFARQPDNGLIKIGHSTQVATRLQILRGAGLSPLVLLGTFPGARQEEARVLSHLFAHHVGHEWFTPHAEVLALVERVSAGRFDVLGLPKARNPLLSQANKAAWARRQSREAA